MPPKAIVDIAEQKTCPVCGEAKPFADFYLRRYKRSGTVSVDSRCKECSKARTYAYRDRHPDRHLATCREYYARTKDARREEIRNNAKHSKTNRANDIKYIIDVRFGGALRRAAKNIKMRRHWCEILGYSTDDVRSHLEKMFLKGMSWSNSREWEIDHIQPLKSFLYTSEDDLEFKAAWALTNLRPIWKSDNRKKSAKRIFLL